MQDRWMVLSGCVVMVMGLAACGGGDENPFGPSRLLAGNAAGGATGAFPQGGSGENGEGGSGETGEGGSGENGEAGSSGGNGSGEGGSGEGSGPVPGSGGGPGEDDGPGTTTPDPTPTPAPAPTPTINLGPVCVVTDVNLEGLFVSFDVSDPDGSSDLVSCQASGTLGTVFVDCDVLAGRASARELTLPTEVTITVVDSAGNTGSCTN